MYFLFCSFATCVGRFAPAPSLVAVRNLVFLQLVVVRMKGVSHGLHGKEGRIVAVGVLLANGLARLVATLSPDALLQGLG